MDEEMYDTSPDMTPEEIERDEALHNLDKRFLIHKHGVLVRKGMLSSKALEAICTIIGENNQNILKVFDFSRHRR